MNPRVTTRWLGKNFPLYQVAHIRSVEDANVLLSVQPHIKGLVIRAQTQSVITRNIVIAREDVPEICQILQDFAAAVNENTQHPSSGEEG